MKKCIKYNFLLSALLLTFLFACKKDKDQHPEIKTVQLSVLSNGKISFKGNIIDKGTFPIVDYGFVYNNDSYFDINRWTKISLGKNAENGNFSTEQQIFLNNIQYSNTLYARAYIANENGIAYGDILNVMMPVSSASNISPTSGKSGDIITVSGQFFAADKSQVRIQMANVNAKVMEITPTKITVEVPEVVASNYSNNTVPVQVYVNNSLIGNYTFKFNTIIKDFFPKSGALNSTITITGENMYSSYYSNMSVYLGNTQVNFSFISNKEIRVTIPTNISTNKFKISILENGKTTTLPDEFTINAPVITSISPVSGLSYSTVTVNGTNLPTSTYNNYSIGDFNLSVSHNTNYVTFTVPTNIPEGDHTVKLKIGPFEVEAPQKFKVIAPSITSFSPTSGSPGQEIELKGTFPPNVYPNILFGSRSASIASNTSNSIRVLVPSGIDAGNVKISIISNGKTITAPGDFAVIGPTITSFAPGTGIAGDLITINGSGFSPYISSNIVRFGSINAQILTASTTMLRVLVPSNINPSTMKITVLSNGQTVISSNNFTLTN